MTHPAPRVAAESARYRIDRAEAIKDGWQRDRRPDAAAALRENPDIAGDRAVAIDLAYEEFCTREEAGEVLDSTAFCARFSFGASLRRLLTLHRFLDDHPDALGGVPTNWPAVGEDVGDFFVLRELGRGSFSRVYLAIETTAGGRPVALKVSAAGSREADTLGPLSHPHLTPVLSSRSAGNWTVVAMPFVGTATLEDVLSVAWRSDRDEAPRSAAVLLEAAGCGGTGDDPPVLPGPAFPLRRATYEDAVGAVAAGLFAGVAYLHEQGIAHRDLKPSNVLLGPNGHPYLLDFNLASRSTDPWRLVGTLPYMAPEQLALMAEESASPPPDGRPGDVFACGVVLFELLTGRHPFGDPSALSAKLGREHVAAALLNAQRAGHLPLAPLNPRVRRAVRAAIGRCLALDPQSRPTAAELVALFTRISAPRARRFVVPVLAGAGILGLVLGYAILRPSTVPAEPVAPASEPPELSPRQRAMNLYQQGKYDLAAVEFQNIAAADNDGRAYGHAAHCLSECRIRDGAIKAADEAIRRGYREAPVYANRAYDHFQGGDLEAAKADCDEALRRDPNLLAARFTRADVYLQWYFKSGAVIPQEAISDIDRVTAGAPNVPDAWITAAQIHLLAPDGGPAARDAAVRAVRHAVSAGSPSKVIESNPVLQELADHPAFKDALAPRANHVAPSINLHLAKLAP
ncbi:protein kinase [Gemmata sp. G18]|uniref:Protein kinase n=1 Tax=Gemmata palustris TaxID=2822762 RepID=A0ABS5C0Q8_9BACT|nr:serine/threonine-protein kinase [Gemmata palustris]MBP3959493.1 protein kinase [Gemmata palustris]